MASSNFIDYVKFCARSGKGGAGSAHLRREKFVPKGGPDGGDGGRGGHIILRGNAQHWTLLHLKYQKHVIAERGENGGGGRKSGAQGEDVILDVPLGTLAKHADSGEVVGEITEDGQEFVLLEGGRGGLGNDHFKTSTFQTPRFAQPGEPGKEEWFILELKVLADVGLIGFPNAGKSTLLSVISAARPEIADYPFTTLTPNLGVVEYRQYKSFVVADIPGIIEGAAEGKGLGTRFLRHIERNAVLLFMIPADSKDINQEYDTLLGELERYNPEMLDKKRLLAITKSDLLDDELTREMKAEITIDIPYIFISAVAEKNISQLKDLLWQTLQ
ncbi:GTP-binding protein [Catalinimonas alkaloidigena]|uniref:GTPase ObgE n=1 Tax=Catalinimonas alkaloidigena TaxID=1075417 RepID=UPI00240615FC|nr:GTPase ObgE [Catalinimonas alkaloidigena]MDF9798486.1 GTP-binding protein [Catalinimonas alkaloidigena]